MKSMDKLTTGVAYGTSAGSAGYWFLQLLDKVTPSQWAAIGVLGSLVSAAPLYAADVPANTPLAPQQVFRYNNHSDPGTLDPQKVEENTAARSLAGAGPDRRRETKSAGTAG